MSSSSDAVARRERIAEKAAAKKRAAAERLKAIDGIYKRFLNEQDRAETLLADGEAEAQRILAEAETAAERARAVAAKQLEQSRLMRAELVLKFSEKSETIEGIADYLELDAKEVRTLLKLARAQREQRRQPALTDPAIDSSQQGDAPLPADDSADASASESHR